MSNEELIRKELNENGIEDNLFDLAVYYSTEIARYSTYCCNRYRNHIVPEQIYNREYQLDKYTEKLLAIYDMLDSLSDETVKFLRKTSSVIKNDILGETSDSLTEIQSKLSTRMNHCVPCRDLEYERVRLGEDSDMYKRLLQLRNLIDNDKQLSKDVLCNFVDIKHHGHNCVEFGWCTQEEYKYYNDFITKYKLSVDDIEYMVSYIEETKKKIHTKKTEETGNG